MKSFLFMLSIFLVYSEIQVYGAVYCIYSVTDSQCNHSDTAVALSNLTDLASISERSVKVYLSTGLHYLSKNFNFSSTVEEIAIQGSKSEISKVHCQNAYGFYIAQKLRVQIMNVHFEHCYREYEYRHAKSLPIGLFISEVEYFAFDSVTISNGAGRGLYTYNCMEQVILSSEFRGNLGGNAKIVFKKSLSNVSIAIINSAFLDGSNTGGLYVYMPENTSASNIIINDSIFAGNRGKQGSHLLVSSYQNVSARLSISNCTFSNGTRSINGIAFGVFIRNIFLLLIQDSNFTKNKLRGLLIVYANQVTITNCLISDHTGTGLFVKVYLTNTASGKINAGIHISNSNFTRNSRALYLWLANQNNRRHLKTVISHCNFSGHIIPEILPTSAARAVVQINGNTDVTDFDKKYTWNVLHIQKSTFEGNYDSNSDCSSLHVTNMDNITLDNLTFKNNNCTGITSIASNITIVNALIMTRNRGLYGGAIHLVSRQITSINKFSMLIINSHSRLYLHKNEAMTYGGGIRTDETCKYRNEEILCFIQFQKIDWIQSVNRNISLILSDNTALKGGDSIFGGCLTNCSLRFQNKSVAVNVLDPNNAFWNFTSIEHKSEFTIAEYPSKVAFCDLERCSSNHSVSVFRGQVFDVPLMIVDDGCIPTVDYIKAFISDTNSSFQLQEHGNHQSKKSCANFSFSLTGNSSHNSTLIKFLPQTLLTDISPAFLSVYIINCPSGFKSGSTTCICHDRLTDYGIVCSSTDMTLQIPAFTWIGDEDGYIGINSYCRFCATEKQTLVNVTEDSDKLCKDQRTGILCGSCSRGKTLLLGGYRCGECNSPLRGIFLTLAFIILGIALILVLFFLNVTVSNGVLNAVIFYCNVIHSNSDIFLPVDHNLNQTSSLQHAVQYLSTFQAWINLDFGVETCYFNGYDTYISTWMQFVFPLYIWLLIVLIVVASRYSSKVSQMTTSNTVPVLATLLLLSYAKLLITCLEVVLLTRLEMLGSTRNSVVWFLDGNIKYFSKKHAPLFLMSVLTMVFYIIPFTLLILLGPFLQAKSEHRFLHWINKLKPLLDAFYGPYTSGYRYWAGILLVARSVLFISIIYSLGDITFKLMSATAVTVLLFIILLFIGQKEKTSIYTAAFKSYLELSIFGNLALFSIIAAYLWSANHTNLRKKQALAVVMAGMVFIKFCGTLLYYTLFKYKLTRIVTNVMSRLKKIRDEEQVSTPAHDHSTLGEVCSTTHSTLAMTESVSMSELREPLLHDQKNEKHSEHNAE